MQKTADVQGLSIPQMLIRNIFMLISTDTEKFPENGIKQKKDKFAQLKNIYRLCQKMGAAENLDMTKAKELKRQTKVQRLPMNRQSYEDIDTSNANDMLNDESNQSVFASSDSDEEGPSPRGSYKGSIHKSRFAAKSLNSARSRKTQQTGKNSISH